MPVFDSASGEANPTQLYVAVPGASNYRYAEAAANQPVGKLDRSACAIPLPDRSLARDGSLAYQIIGQIS